MYGEKCAYPWDESVLGTRRNVSETIDGGGHERNGGLSSANAGSAQMMMHSPGAIVQGPLDPGGKGGIPDIQDTPGTLLV